MSTIATTTATTTIAPTTRPIRLTSFLVLWNRLKDRSHSGSICSGGLTALGSSMKEIKEEINKVRSSHCLFPLKGKTLPESRFRI